MPVSRSRRVQLVLTVTLFSIITYLLVGAPTFPAKTTAEPDFIYPASAHPKAIQQDRPKRVAIVGAGASGSAAAWFLSRAGKVMSDRMGKEVLGEIVVFEQEGRVGGRELPTLRVAVTLIGCIGTTTVHPHGDERLRAQELGASIFVTANRYLQKAAKVCCSVGSPSPIHRTDVTSALWSDSHRPGLW